MAASIPVLRALMRDSRPGPPRFYSFTGVSTKDRGQARRQLTDSYFRGPSPSAFASTNNLLDGKGGDWKQSSPVDTVPPSPPPTLATLRPISILRMPSVDFGDGTVLRTPRTPKNVHVRFSEKIG